MKSQTLFEKSEPLRLIRGAVLAPRDGEMHFFHDALIRIDSKGKISEFRADATLSQEPITAPGCVWMPGLVDTHVHFPQTRVIARSSGALLPWLNQTVFPEESRFSDQEYAKQVAQEFCHHLISNGTTCASIYGSSHLDATDILFQALDRSGLRAQAGPTLMDQGAPESLCVPPGKAIEACRTLIRKWHGHDQNRLRFVVTPRFALSCSRSLLKDAGQLAAEFDLPIQTHLSENHDEIAAVKAAFPEAENYLSVYHSHGLCTHRSLFAHAIHLEDPEWNLLKETRGSLSHCPDSNFFLGSGVFRLKKAVDQGIPVGLGSDVGAGRTFDLRRIAASAYDASLLAQNRVSPSQILWQATVGGAQALGLDSTIGKIEPGFEADLIAIQANTSLQVDALLDQIVFQSERTPVRSTLVRGRRLG
jgi:guanine deaminase